MSEPPALDRPAMEAFLALTIERRGLGYRADFATWDLLIEVDHLRRTRGELHAELTVFGPWGPGGTFHRGAHNLSSVTARGSLARSLAERTAGQHPLVPWREVVERLAVTVLLAEQEATPTELVGQRPAAESAAWRVEPILPRSKPTILYGEGGTGKSYLALALALSVETGEEIVPGWRPIRAPTLYLDWETDADDLDCRVKAIAAGAGLDYPSLRYRSCAVPLASMVDGLAAEVAAQGIGLLAVDSVGLASGQGHEGAEASETTLRLFAALRAIGTTSLLVDHVAKIEGAVETRHARPYGSVYKTNLARSTFELRRFASPGEDGLTHLGLYHTKSNLSRLLPPQGIAMHHTDGTVVFTREPLVDELTAPLTTPARIALWLQRQRRGTVKEIAEALGEDETKVRVALNRHKGRQFAKAGESWGLLDRIHGEGIVQ